MSKRIALVGHCGPDSSYLAMAVRRAVPDATVVRADEQSELDRALSDGVSLLLINRSLDYGFDETSGVDLIRRLKQSHPDTRLMLVSNFADAQAQAAAVGALPGFGKKDLGSPRVSEVLTQALAE